MDPGLNATKRPPTEAGGRDDDVAAVRLTSTPTVNRTAAATAARRQARARRIAYELGVERLSDLDDEQLVALASALVAESYRRGVADRICAPVPPKRRAN